MDYNLTSKHPLLSLDKYAVKAKQNKTKNNIKLFPSGNTKKID